MEAPTGCAEVETRRRVLAGDECASGVVKQKWRRFERRDEDENKRGEKCSHMVLSDVTQRKVIQT